jgi:hypothetical protein
MLSVTSSTSRGGGSKSGNPCDKLIAPHSCARRDMTVKIVVPTRGNFEGGSANTTRSQFRQIRELGMDSGDRRAARTRRASLQGRINGVPAGAPQHPDGNAEEYVSQRPKRDRSA